MPTTANRFLTLAVGASLAVGAWLAVPSTARAQLSPEESLKSLKGPDGLEITLFATEPDLVNPTDIDIDARGRVWVLEAANYRKFKTRPEGDRIVILEDTDGDGKSDKTKVFYQDPSLFSPLGIAVLGNKVYVAQSPTVLVFTIDESGDKPAGPPEVLFSGFTGVNHDHGVHAGVFGPDGRYYFNCGNDGMGGLIVDKDKKPVVDSTGSEMGRNAKQWRGKPRDKGELGYTDGMAFRCDLDGKNFETLGYNFRNNYEVTVDSFGTVWQSDNDDDGNQAVRINYVMEGGNFGFKGPKGSAWGRDQGLIPEQTRQEAHWHLRWPGVVPNLLHLGGGSPTGITVYEGDLLPEKYRGALLHCDAGPNVVHAFMTTPSGYAPTGLMPGITTKDKNIGHSEVGPSDKAGAGYKVTEIVQLIKGKDSWFRPADVCVAPDGSVFVADWYDPGVGGHNMQDKEKGAKDPTDWRHLRGRIYRIAPPGTKYAVPKLDLGTVAGQIAALKSPNYAARYVAWTKLHEGGPEAVKALEAMWNGEKNPRLRARAFWLLARSADGKKYVEAALKEKDADLRVAALRAARLIKMDIPAIATGLLADDSPLVARELCLAMNYEPADNAVPILVKLADKYDGKDRWYLEALGIGAIGKEDAFLSAWEKGHTNKAAEAEKNILWRMKREAPGGTTAAKQASAAGAETREGSRPFRRSGREVTASSSAKLDYGDIGRESGAMGCGTPPVSPVTPKTRAGEYASPWHPDDARSGPRDGVTLDCSESGAMGCGTPLPVSSVTPKTRAGEYASPWHPDDAGTRRRGSGTSRSWDGLMFCAEPLPGAVPPPVAPAAKPSAPTTAAATSQPTVFKDKDGKLYPPLEKLALMKGDARRGAALFISPNVACIRCHQIGTDGEMVGPPLTVVGDKLNKQQMIDAIFTPNASILMEYETWRIKTKDGKVQEGLKVEDTPDHITLKDSAGKYHDIKLDDIDTKRMLTISLMPEGLQAAMTPQEMADLLEYLASLKNQ